MGSDVTQLFFLICPAFFFSSRRQHTRWPRDWSSTCALPIFFIFDSLLSWPYLVANAIAIVLSILFAYVTNKLFVFKTSSNDLKENIYEFIKFIGFRLLSGLADMFSMWVLVDLIFVDTNLAKLLTQFIVVVLNYVFSKFFIFL